MNILSTLKKFALFILFLFIPTLSFSASDHSELKGLYYSLDSMIHIQNELVKNKEKKIKDIHKYLLNHKLTNIEIYQINNKLYEEYAAFKYDSAYIYVQRNILLSQEIKDSILYYRSMMNKAHILSVAGLFEEANDVLKSINPNKFTNDDLIYYYNLYNDLQVYKAEFTQGTQYSTDYIKHAISYREKILAIATPGTYQYIFIKASYDCQEGNMNEAIKSLMDYLPSLEIGSREYSIMTSTLAFFYGINKDSTLQKKYFILSAISDLKGCIRETNSLRVLSSMLFSEGDIDRAYNYLNVCINDANFYGARLRNIQAGQLIPYVVAAYQKKQVSHNKMMLTLLTISGAFIFVLIGGLILISIIMKKYNKANLEINKMNDELNKFVNALKKNNEEIKLINCQMKESNRIKEEYVGRFIELSSSYIEVFDNHRKMINKLAMNHKLAELYAELKSDHIMNDSVSLFYQNFDSAFLNIYPNFVIEINKLLKPEYIIIQKNEKQLNTELRVFALIRLGITDNQKIASILRSSITTIYTYRSKIKNKSWIKDNFENRIAEIDSYINMETIN